MRFPTIYAHRRGGLAVSDALNTIEKIYKESKVIIFGCQASWTIYHLRRVRRAVHDETLRYHARHIPHRGETVDRINGILARIWHLYQPRIHDHIVQYVSRGLAAASSLDNQADDPPAQKVVIPVPHAGRAPPPPPPHPRLQPALGSGNFVLEGHFHVDLAPPPDHHRSHPRTREQVIDLVIVHNRRAHDLAVQVLQFTGTGLLRLGIDFCDDEPLILRPQLELQGPPRIDCTYPSVSQHHFPFHFAHHIDWQRKVEGQIREGLGWAFRWRWGGGGASWGC